MIVVIDGEKSDGLIWKSDKDLCIAVMKAKEVVRMLKRENPNKKYRVFNIIASSKNEWLGLEIEVE